MLQQKWISDHNGRNAGRRKTTSSKLNLSPSMRSGRDYDYKLCNTSFLSTTMLTTLWLQYLILPADLPRSRCFLHDNDQPLGHPRGLQNVYIPHRSHIYDRFASFQTLIMSLNALSAASAYQYISGALKKEQPSPQSGKGEPASPHQNSESKLGIPPTPAFPPSPFPAKDGQKSQGSSSA